MPAKDSDPPPREGRTAWHVLLTRLLQQRAPPSFRVLSEVPLGKHPPRLDLLLLRREGSDDDSGAAVFRRLWRLILRLAILEYKSASKPLRRGELAKVLSYAFLYAADHPDEVASREDLLVALVLPSLSPTLHSELAFFGLTLTLDPQGYHRVEGGPWPLLVIELDLVSQAEQDELLGVFGHGKLNSRESVWWWQQQTGEKMAELTEMEGYDEVVERFLASLPPEQRLAGLAPEQRLAGLAPEQRLAGLAPEEVLSHFAPEERLVDLGDRAILAMPDHLLKMLPDEAFANLPGDVREAIRQRIGRLPCDEPDHEPDHDHEDGRRGRRTKTKTRSGKDPPPGACRAEAPRRTGGPRHSPRALARYRSSARRFGLDLGAPHGAEP